MSRIKKSDLATYVIGILECLGVIFFAAGWISHIFNIMTIGLCFCFLHNIIFSFRNIKSRILFFIFNITWFTFLLSRPLIGMFRHIAWWNTASQGEENIRFAFLVMFISIICLYLGAIAAEYTHKRLKKPNVMLERKLADGQYLKVIIRRISLTVFLISAFFFFSVEIEKLLFMRGKSYIEYYSEFQSQLPGMVHTVASFMKYSLCIFLATFPSKKVCFIPLFIFECSAIPELLIGVRNPIVLNSIFIFCYYFIRDKVITDKEKWIGKIETAISIIAIPCMMFLMSIWSYIRNDMKLVSFNPIKLILDFFYGQGVTFDVLAIGYGWQLGLPQRETRNYTFGGMIDYIVHGRIGQAVFGTSGLPEGNNITNAIESNSLAHHLSYVYSKNSYLEGNGLGTSYLLEGYLDFGYIGVFLINIVLGFILVYFLFWFKNNVLINTIILLSMSSIFFVPRAETTGWLTFIVTVQFWACMIMCYVGSIILFKFLNFIRRRHDGRYKYE